MDVEWIRVVGLTGTCDISVSYAPDDAGERLFGLEAMKNLSSLLEYDILYLEDAFLDVIYSWEKAHNMELDTTSGPDDYLTAAGKGEDDVDVDDVLIEM